MLIPDQKIEITIGGRTIKYYKSIGYTDIKSRQKITIPVEQLIPTSHEKILVQCDSCNKIFEREYRKKIELNEKHNGLDLCHECAGINAMIEKYGVANPMFVDEFKEKMFNTCFEKYGTRYIIQNEEIKEKIKQTNLKKYGVEYASQADVIKEKVKKTCLERYSVEYYIGSEDRKRKTKEFYNKNYNVDNSRQVKEINDKIKETNLKKYGAENVFGSEEIKKKIKDYWKNKFGVEYYSQTDEFKEKFYNTCMEKYGVSTTLLLETTREKGREYWQRLYGVDYPLQSNIYWRDVFHKKLMENGNSKVWTSKQQIEIYNMLKNAGYNVILNHLLLNDEKRMLLDVALFIDDIKIDIEYDGWYWHQDKQKDRARDEVLKKIYGWKIFRIRGGMKIPSLSDLESCIQYLLVNKDKYFTMITMSDWKEVGEERGESA